MRDDEATGTSEFRAVAEEAGAMVRHGVDAARRWISDRSRTMRDHHESDDDDRGQRWRDENDARRSRQAAGGYEPQDSWERGDAPGRGRASSEEYSGAHYIGGGAAGGDRERRGGGTGEYGIGQPYPYASRGEQEYGSGRMGGESRGGWQERGGRGEARSEHARAHARHHRGSWLEDDGWRDRGDDRIPDVSGPDAGRPYAGPHRAERSARQAYGGFSDDIGGRGYRGYDRAEQHDFGAGAPGAMRGGFRGRGPRGYTRSDARIAEDLNETLADDDFIDASDIEVQVKDGVVSLAGTVGHRWMKHRVEDIAEACSGVRDIDNRIRVQRDEERERTGTRYAGSPDASAEGMASPEKSGAAGLGQGERGGSLEPSAPQGSQRGGARATGGESGDRTPGSRGAPI